MDFRCHVSSTAAIRRVIDHQICQRHTLALNDNDPNKQLKSVLDGGGDTLRRFNTSVRVQPRDTEQKSVTEPDVLFRRRGVTLSNRVVIFLTLFLLLRS